MRLNSNKCTFNVSFGKFMGFMMNHRGIDPNPDKIRAIIKMRTPRTMKDVQKLIGRLAAFK